MGSREALNAIFVDITTHTYFQPPSNMKMEYPAIKYNVSDFKNTHADDAVYIQRIGYSVTVIDPNPDSNVVDKVSKLPMCSFDRAYHMNNLNHTVFTLYY